MDISEITDVNLNINSLTIGEIEDIEDALDAEFSTILNGTAGIRQGKFTRVLVYTALKREHPDITMEDVRSLPLDVLNNSNVGEADVDPT